MNVGFYRKKPIIVEAMQLIKDEDVVEAIRWIREGGYVANRTYLVNFAMNLTTLEGDQYASWDDWIVKGVQGEFYPVKPSIFDATYELIYS